MNQNLFRQESIEQMNSPSQFYDLVVAVRPKIWLILAMVVVLCLGLIGWGFMSTIENTVSVIGYHSDIVNITLHFFLTKFSKQTYPFLIHSIVFS